VIRQYAQHAASLRLDLLPCPYLGRPEALVYVLLLNPGGRHNDFEYGDEFVAERRRALQFESPRCFWSLDPALARSEAYKYSATRMRALIDQVGRHRVADRMMWLQYFGYQSLEWRRFPVTLPSQEFAFWLLREAIGAGKLVIIARSRRLWIRAVSELETCDYIQLRSPRGPYLTPANMGEGDFRRVVRALSD
jgi:hypothetical protein